MDEISNVGGNQITMVGEDSSPEMSRSTLRRNEGFLRFFISLSLVQKLMAELIGTYFLIFVSCATVVVNVNKDKVVTLPGIAMVWGLVVMVMIYCVGHISGAHFNPAVTIAFASCNKFPWKQVPAYVITQVLGSTLASETVRLIFKGKQNQILTLPAGSDLQSLVLEFITTFYLMFGISAIAATDQAIKEVAGVTIGATISIDILFAGPISGASMNPARSLGPAVISSHYKGLWIYIVGPISGAIAGAWVYEILRLAYKPSHNVTKNKRNKQTSISSSRQSLLRVAMDDANEELTRKCELGWTCFITKTDPTKAGGKAYYTCGDKPPMNINQVSNMQQNQEMSREGTTFCKCDEGWSCVISMSEEDPQVIKEESQL